MTTQQPQGAREVTNEEATRLIAEAKAGIPAAPATSEPKAEPPKAAEETKQDDFVLMNPPYAVYRPQHTEEPIRGYVLREQHDVGSGIQFFVVQLTQPCGCLQVKSGPTPEPGPVGMHVAVYLEPTLDCLNSLLPSWNGKEKCYTNVAEVIITPFRDHREGWDYLVSARKLAACPDARLPAFAGVPELRADEDDE